MTGFPADAAFAITLDIDWAPDFIIDWVANRLAAAGAKATWMVTHYSPALARLRERPDLFELGIHPNFLPGSSHGSEVAQVLAHCMALVPEARCLRTHGLVQSTAILEAVMQTTPIAVDLSLFYPVRRHVEAFRYRWKGRSLLRIPFFWEDDFAMELPGQDWDPAPLLQAEGMRILNFHPVHLYLNQPATAHYHKIVQQAGYLPQATPDQFASRIGQGEGPRRMLDRLIAHQADGWTSLTVSELASLAGHPVTPAGV